MRDSYTCLSDKHLFEYAQLHEHSESTLYDSPNVHALTTILR